MRLQKQVTLLVILVLTFVIFSGVVSAANYNFRASNDVSSTQGAREIHDYGTGGAFAPFLNEYLIRFPTLIYPDQTDAGLGYSDEQIQLQNPSRYPSYEGKFFGGYLYVTQPITSHNMEVGSYGSHGSKNWRTTAGYRFYQLDQNAVAQPIQDYLATSPGNYVECIFAGTVADNADKGTAGRGATSFETKSCGSISVNSPLEPGIYYIVGGVAGARSQTEENRRIGSSVNIMSFNQATFATGLNQISTRGYAITDNLMTASELNAEFGSLVDEQDFLCQLAGGDYDPNTDPTNPAGQCCGNVLSDEGGYDDTTGLRCTQLSGGVWTWVDDASQCMQPSGGAADYVGSLNTNYNANDGTDGCCGDDGSDRAFVSSDGEFFCSQEYSPSLGIVQDGNGEFKWWSAIDEPYNTHRVGNVDYISNGEDWFMCNPDDISRADQIGRDELLPAATRTDPNTCVGVMNQLVDLGFFSIYQPNGEVIEFVEGDPQTDTFVCNTLATTDPLLFFDTIDTTSCVNSCFTQSGTSVYSDGNIDASLSSVCAAGNFAGCALSDGNLGDAPDLGEVDQIQCYLDFAGCSGVGTVYQTNQACGDFTIQDEGFTGTLCQGQTPVCVTKEYLYSSDHNPTNGAICCRDDPNLLSTCEALPEATTVTDASCEFLGGDWLDETSVSDNEVANYQCISLEGQPVGRCCLGKWTTSNNFFSNDVIDYSGAFSCTDVASESRLVECCGDFGECHGTQTDTIYHSSTTSNGRWTSKGGTNFMILNYDYFANGFLDAKVFSTQTSFNSPAVIGIPSGLPNRQDWRGFTELHFDIGYALDVIDQVVITHSTGTLSRTLENYLVDGTAPGEIHHAIVAIPSNLDGVQSISFTTTNVIPVTLVVDNFYLSGGLKENELRYCTGSFRTWVDNLDGQSDNGFAPSATIAEYAPYREACDAIGSFGWTGRRCCGDDTTLTTQEYYLDTQAGCFAGNIVDNNERTSEALNDLQFQNLLFFDEDFNECTLSPTDYPTSYQTQYPITITHPSNNLVPLVTMRGQGAEVGSYICQTDAVGQAAWILSKRLECEITGVHDYLDDSELRSIVLNQGDYNLDPQARCCAKWDTTIGGINGDFECVLQNDGTYSWNDNLAGGGGYCEQELGGDSLLNYADYGLTADQACCNVLTEGDIVYDDVTGDGVDEIIAVCLEDATSDGSITIPGDLQQHKWWVASNPFQVHARQPNEIVSNGESFYQCGIDLQSGEVLPDESAPTCLQKLNEIQASDGFSYLGGIGITVPTFGTCGANNEFCCTNNPTYERNHFLSTQSEVSQNDLTSCDVNCYIRQDERLLDYRQTTLEDTQFHTDFCADNPQEKFCLEQNPQNQENPQELTPDSYPLWDTSCSLIETNPARREVCSASDVCITGEYYLAKEFYSGGGVCCVGDQETKCVSIPSPEQVTAENCVEYQGDWLDTPVAENDVCTSEKTSGQCCYDGNWELRLDDIESAIDVTVASGFLCHQRGNEFWFTECCSGPDCQGLEPNALFSNIQNSEENPLNGVVGAGASAGIIDNFDTVSAAGFSQGVARQDIFTSSNPLTLTLQNVGRNVGNLENSQLFFDVFFTAPFITFIEIRDVNGALALYNFPTTLIDGNDPLVWHSAQLDLTSFISQTPGFDWTQVATITFTTSSGLPFSVRVDNLRLSTGADTQYYCSGVFGEWLGDLDGMDTTLTGTELVLETVKYQDTCNAAGSGFSWTGTLCCGDDTTLTTREIYNDTRAGCFYGQPITNGDVVGKTINDVSFNTLLYQNDRYNLCDAGSDAFLPPVLPPPPGSGNPIQTVGGLNVAPEDIYAPFETIDSFMCDVTGEWIALADVSQTKLLASKLYDIVSGENEYGIHCNSEQEENLGIDRVSPSDLSLLLTEFQPEQVADFCAAQIYEEQGSAGYRSIAGFRIADEVLIEDFLNSYSSHLVSLGLVSNNPQSIQTFAQSCSPGFLSTGDEFFSTCQPSGKNNRIRMLYSPDNDILLVTYSTQPDVDFQGLFNTQSLQDYVRVMYHLFINLFTGTYTETPQEAVDERLPDIVAQTDFAIDRIIMLKKGDRQITGFAEKDDDPEDTLVVVEYRNFVSDVSPLASRYFGSPDELNYQKGINRQVIQVYEAQADTRLQDYEQPFDWRTFTSALRLDPGIGGARITSTSDDGILDIGEDCDTSPLGPDNYVYKDVVYDGIPLASTTCGEWDSLYYYNDQTNANELVSCLPAGAGIDYFACNYCGDGRQLDGEACDDGNNINGDGCSTSCELEFCGDGFIGLGEFCDAGTNNGQGYQDAACDPSTHCNADCTGYSPCIGDGICENTLQEVPSTNPQFPPLEPVCGYANSDGDGYDVQEEFAANCYAGSDNDPNTYPGAPEICDGVDNDCDGLVDAQDFSLEAGPAPQYTVGVCAGATTICQGGSWVEPDYGIGYEPGDELTCDGLDNDCDGQVDEGITATDYYLDADGDGYGDQSQLISTCAPPANYVTAPTGVFDCNDDPATGADINPGVEEGNEAMCFDGVDNDCDGQIDNQDDSCRCIPRTCNGAPIGLCNGISGCTENYACEPRSCFVLTDEATCISAASDGCTPFYGVCTGASFCSNIGDQATCDAQASSGCAWDSVPFGRCEGTFPTSYCNGLSDTECWNEQAYGENVCAYNFDFCSGTETTTTCTYDSVSGTCPDLINCRFVAP